MIAHSRETRLESLAIAVTRADGAIDKRNILRSMINEYLQGDDRHPQLLIKVSELKKLHLLDYLAWDIVEMIDEQR